MRERALRRCLALALLTLAAPAGLAAQEEERDEREEREERAPDRMPAGPDGMRRPLPRMRPAPPPRAPALVPARGATAQPDSVMQALRGLEGYTVTTYSGSYAEFDADSGVVVLGGVAALERQGQTIEADSLLTFNRESGVVCGYGSPVLSGEGTPIASEQICYDTERRVGMALGARTEFQQNATWFVHGERVFTVGSNAVYGAGTEFTTCDLEVPHYHFRASRLKMISDNIMVARDVTLNFGDVPVFWLPFLVQSLREGRRSGLLTPTVSISDVVQTSSNHTREVRNLGVFWAINDYTGAELAMDWRSSEWVALRGRFDYRWTRQFLQGYINAQQYFREGGRRDLTLNTSNGWQPGERTQVRVSGQYSSSNEFVRRNTYSPDELSRSLRSDAGISHRFEGGGSIALSASRDQQILADRTTTILPSLNLSLPAMTLAAPRIGGEVQELVWTTSTSYTAAREDRDESGSTVLSDRDGRTQAANLNSTFRFGNLSFSQSVNARDAGLEAKPVVEGTSDTTVALPAETTRSLDWNAGLNYRQDLIGTMRITPSLSLNGSVRESPLTGDRPVTAPLTVNFGAELAADVFGFWPGVGPFERFRHRISPKLSYRYRPEPEQTQLQDSVFGAATQATNVIQLGFSQTFEAKRPAEEASDSAGDAASDDRASASDEPRRLSGQQPIRLLSISTSAIAYDFERAANRENGLTTRTVTNSITSDLLKNLSFTFTHSLFRPITNAAGTEIDRTFDLHLDRVNARFGLSGESWLFRWLGAGGETEAETPSEEALDTLDAEQLLPESSSRGLVPGAGRQSGTPGMGRVGSTGTWRADFDYSLQRPRDTTLDGNQMLTASLAFQPTENWSVGWQTGYSITDSEFLNNSIVLTRALHRWQADFRILRAQNGNFSFEFEARLSDLPDLKVPYDQRTRGDTD